MYSGSGVLAFKKRRMLEHILKLILYRCRRVSNVIWSHFAITLHESPVFYRRYLILVCTHSVHTQKYTLKLLMVHTQTLLLYEYGLFDLHTQIDSLNYIS